MKQQTSNVVAKAQAMEKARNDRRAKAEEQKNAKIEKAAYYKAQGVVCDVDFAQLIEAEKNKVGNALNHVSASQMALCVCIRKRPLFHKEVSQGEIDAVSMLNPKVVVHEPKIKVDGITKYVQNFDFKFDNAYAEHEDTHAVYEYQIKDLLPKLFSQGVITVFAYGQTGSGKTFTMASATQSACSDLFKIAPKDSKFAMSFFEIYGGKVSDLLNKKAKLQIQEDGNGKIQVSGLQENPAHSSKEMIDIINFGHSERTTHCTAANDTSSRSHAICQIKVRNNAGKLVGKLLLVDLAGSERAQDTQSNNRNRRMEGAEINKSLLALKECIRALDDGKSHVPFRASKLTMVLRDSFLNKTSSKIVMIACINPGSSSSDHTLNTLRYADRLKTNNTGAYKNEKEIGFAKIQEGQQPAPQKAKPQWVDERKQQQHEMMQDEPPRQKQQLKPPTSQPHLPPINNQGLGPPPQSQAANGNRAKWGNRMEQPTAERGGSQAALQVPQQKPPQYNKGKRAGSENRFQEEPRKSPVQMQQQKPQNQKNANLMSPEHHKQKMDDLRMTLGFGQGANTANKIDNNLLTFHEKVDSLLEEEDELRLKHVEYVREAAKLLNQEGELIAKSQGVGAEEQDIEEYIDKMESIVTRNLAIYGDLQARIGRFKRLLKEEEEAHQNVRETFYY